MLIDKRQPKIQEINMKKLIVVTTHTGGGGIGRYICGLVEELAHRSWHIHVYCLKYQNNAFENFKNIQVTEFSWIRKLPRELRQYVFAKKIKSLTKNSDTPILSTVRIFNPTLIIVGGVHQTHTATRKKGLSLYDRIEIYLEKSAYKNAKYIIAHSPLMVNEIATYKLNVQNKIHMYYPPASEEIFKYAAKEEKLNLRKKLNLPENKFLAIGAGTCDERKGIPMAAKAFEQLSDNFHLMIFGSKYTKSLPPNAHHYGEVNNLQEYFAAADCTLVPSIYEPFGLVIIESLQCGTPVIISKEVGAQALVAKSEGIILEERSPDAIKNAILEMNTKPYIIEPSFIKRNNLTWSDHTDKIEALLLKN